MLVALVLLGHPVFSRAAEPESSTDGQAMADEFADEREEPPMGFPDPLEPINRGTLVVNQQLDRFIFNPITQVYRFAVPDPARRAVRRALSNLNSPSVLVNDLLQREWKDAGTTVARFTINSTVGLAGIFDPAADLGIHGHSSDFGQTLALAGVKSGPYLVLPLFGPTTLRDGMGNLVDVLFRPATYLLGGSDQIFYATIQGGSSGLAIRDEQSEAIEMLEESSVDYYAALRNAYYQNRTAEIWSRCEDHRSPETEVVSAAPSATGAGSKSSTQPSDGGSGLPVPGDQGSDLAVDGRDQGVKALALEH